MKTLAILGASGHGKVLADLALVCGFEKIDFFDDRSPKLNILEHWDVVGDSRTLLTSVSKYSGVIVAIGHNETRLRKQLLLKNAGARMATLIHPTATISQFAEIGEGSVLMAGTVVNAFCKIGKCNIINTSATVDHDCKLGDAVHISPGVNLAGSVLIGDCTWIGIGACVIQSISIGSNVIVGAGSTVIDSLKDKSSVVGSPAKTPKSSF